MLCPLSLSFQKPDLFCSHSWSETEKYIFKRRKQRASTINKNFNCSVTKLFARNKKKDLMKFETFSIPDGSATLLSWCCKIPKSKRYFYRLSTILQLGAKIIQTVTSRALRIYRSQIVFEMMVLLQISFSVSFGLKQRFYPDSIFFYFQEFHHDWTQPELFTRRCDFSGKECLPSMQYVGRVHKHCRWHHCRKFRR